MANLVLVRHAQSQWNLENRFTGLTDVPLTDLGRQEAEAAGTLLREYHFACAFTSVLQRAEETLAIILQTIGQTLIPVTRDAALDERDYGDLTGMNKDEAAQRYGADQVRQWRRSWDVRPPGGESLKDTAHRAFPYFQRHIRPRVVGGENVLVVAHGNSLRAIVKELEGVSDQTVPTLEVPVATPYIYTFDHLGEIVGKEVRDLPAS